MFNSLLTRVLTTAALALCVGTISASAQATRTWVSGVGDDVNPCSRTAPCKTWAGAISKTAAGGEIDALDPGGFGTVNITKAITIDGGGGGAGFGSILAAGAGVNGVIVNAGVNDKVILRNLSINGAGTGLNGIRYIAGKSLSVVNTQIFGVTNHGIDVALTNDGSISVYDTNIQNVNGSGIRLNSTSGMVLATLDHVRVERSALDGLDVVGRSRVVARNSVFAFNGNAGIHAESLITGFPNHSQVDVNTCQLNMNNAGLIAGPDSVTIRVTNSHIAINNFNWQINGGLLFSFGDNVVAGNVTTNPASVPAPTKM